MLFAKEISFPLLHSLGYIYGLDEVEDSVAFYYPDIPRNAGSNLAAPFIPFYNVNWNGLVCRREFGVGCDNANTVLLLAGQYRIRFSALKHFGNAAKSNDYDVYVTPLFNLIYSQTE